MNDPYDGLYGFQRQTVDHLVHHGGGFCWSDPGLGKTRMAIIAAKRLGGRPVLVVCPNSLKRWWRDEIRTIYPRASVVMAGVGGRFGSRNINNLPTERPLPVWWIVHYTGVRLNEHLRRIPWSTVILDECHYIKNRKARRTLAVFDTTPKLAYRIGLSATPYGNNPADLWAQLRWLAPHVPGLRSYWRFFNTFVDYDYEKRGNQQYRKINGGKNLKLLARVMAAYGIRHSKRDVATQLPPITDTYIPVDFNGVQKAVYGMLRNKANVELEFSSDDGATSYSLVIRNALSRLIKMEQWLSHPWTFMGQVDGAKMQWLKEWANGYNNQAVIGTRFKPTAYRIVEELNVSRNGRSSDYADAARHPITGDIGVGTRQSIIDDWKAGKHQFLVGTIDTIGIGFSFEQAHAMVMFDQLWSTIKMEQARQRIHRITSKHPVQILYPYVPNTTNEVVMQAFNSNWRQIELVRAFLRHVQSEEENNGTH